MVVLIGMGIVSGVDIIFHASQLSSLPFAKLHIGSFPAIWEAPQTDEFSFLFLRQKKKMARQLWASPLVKCLFWFVATPRSIMSCLKIEGYKENTYCGKKNPTMISAIRLNAPSIAVLQIDLKLWCDWELLKLLTYQIAIVGELCNFAILQSSLLPKSLLTNNLNWFWYKQLEAIIGQECDTPANYWPWNWWNLG